MVLFYFWRLNFCSREIVNFTSFFTVPFYRKDMFIQAFVQSMGPIQQSLGNIYGDSSSFQAPSVCKAPFLFLFLYSRPSEAFVESFFSIATSSVFFAFLYQRREGQPTSFDFSFTSTSTSARRRRRWRRHRSWEHRRGKRQKMSTEENVNSLSKKRSFGSAEESQW